jgi:hypothetical protein
MRGSRHVRSAIGVLALLVAAATLVPAGPAQAAEYTMVTRAAYVAEPDAEKVTVTVEIDFTNTFQAPAGQVSIFREIRLAIHDHAAVVAAHDATGALTTTTAASDGVNVATITLRSPVEYQQTANLTLDYELRDGDDPAIRVGSHLLSFPAWGFGTASEVRVDLPADFEVRVDGNALESTTDGDVVSLSSGPIADPAQWLAHVGGIREPPHVTLQQAVPLSGGTVDLQVRHWEDDPEWGAATMDLLVEALPLLETVFGVPYAGQGPVVVTESVTAGALDEETDGEISVGFAEPPFTVLHQVAHLWSDGLMADRWAAEGLASWAAAEVSAEMDVPLPHDPSAVASNLTAHAFPLVDWTDDALPAEAEGWAYAMAWSLTNQTAQMASPDGLRLALVRIASGLDGYDDAPEQIDAPSSPSAAVSSRAYLDHLDAVTDEPIVEAIAPAVLGEGAAAELTARVEARTARDELLDAAGDWGDPDPVRVAMVEWRFADAQVEIAAALEWLGARDELLGEIEAAGLTAPDRLAAAYRTHGGADPAWAEIAAERAVVEAYVKTAEVIHEGIGPLARIGLLPGPSPEDQLASAATAFAAGDLRVAADLLTELQRDLETATAGGLIRLLGLAVAAAAAALLIAMAIRRRRSTSDYTPEA